MLRRTIHNALHRRGFQVFFVLAGLSAVAGGPAHAQAAAPSAVTTPAVKRALAQPDFDAWRSIATPVLSRDGKWLAYSMQPQDGDGELVIRELATGNERREAIGALPPPNQTPNEENPDAPPVPRAIRLLFTSDSQFVLASNHPTKAELAAARKARKRPEDLPKGGLLVVQHGQAQAWRATNVKSFQVPARGGAWVAYLKEETRAEAPTGATPTPAGGDSGDAQEAGAQSAPARSAGPDAGANAPGTGAARKTYGTDLVLRDLASGSERVFASI